MVVRTAKQHGHCVKHYRQCAYTVTHIHACVRRSARLTLAIRQFAIGESRSLLAKKNQDSSPIWQKKNIYILFFIFRITISSLYTFGGHSSFRVIHWETIVTKVHSQTLMAMKSGGKMYTKNVT